MKHYLIVGLGTSGAVLARRLAERQNTRVTVLEAGHTAGDFPELRDPKRLAALTREHPATSWHESRLTPEKNAWLPRGLVSGGSSTINGGYFEYPSRFDLKRWQHDLQITDPEETLDAVKERSRVITETPPQSGELAGRFNLAAAETGLGDFAHPVHTNFKNGERLSVADYYLNDLPENAAIEIVFQARAERVIFEGSRAIGIATASRNFYADDIVLAAGTIETTRLLMRSGIGPAAELSKHKIPIIADLPVGVEFSDHPSVHLGWKSHRVLFRDSEEFIFPSAMNIPVQLKDGRNTPVEILLSVKPREVLIAGSSKNLQPNSPDEDSLSYTYELFISLMQPRSRGTIGLSEMSHNYLSNRQDLEALREALRTATDLLQSAAFRDVFAGFKNLTENDLQKSEKLDRWILANLDTSQHASSSAKAGSVTDSSGRVYSVQNLIVADLSILPDSPSRGTFASAVFIAELLSDRI